MKFPYSFVKQSLLLKFYKRSASLEHCPTGYITKFCALQTRRHDGYKPQYVTVLRENVQFYTARQTAPINDEITFSPSTIFIYFNFYSVILKNQTKTGLFLNHRLQHLFRIHNKKVPEQTSCGNIIPASKTQISYYLHMYCGNHSQTLISKLNRNQLTIYHAEFQTTIAIASGWQVNKSPRFPPPKLNTEGCVLAQILHNNLCDVGCKARNCEMSTNTATYEVF